MSDEQHTTTPSLGRLLTSEGIGQLAGALATAQGAFANPAKDKTAKVKMRNGGEYSFSYADLASVMDAVRQALSLNGLALIQAPSIEYFAGDQTTPGTALVSLTTRLIHSSGEWVESTVTIGAEEQRAQVVASAITYAKRYAIQAMLGVVAEEDDDGNAASGNTANIQTRLPAAAAPAPAAAIPSAANPGAARFEKARLSLSHKMGFDEAEHQINAIKKKHADDVKGKLAALVEIEALDAATPTAKSGRA